MVNEKFLYFLQIFNVNVLTINKYFSILSWTFVHNDSINFENIATMEGIHEDVINISSDSPGCSCESSCVGCVNVL